MLYLIVANRVWYLSVKYPLCRVMYVHAIAWILIAWNIFMVARLFMKCTSTRRGTIFLVFQMMFVDARGVVWWSVFDRQEVKMRCRAPSSLLIPSGKTHGIREVIQYTLTSKYQEEYFSLMVCCFENCLWLQSIGWTGQYDMQPFVLFAFRFIKSQHNALLLDDFDTQHHGIHGFVVTFVWCSTHVWIILNLSQKTYTFGLDTCPQKNLHLFTFRRANLTHYIRG